jgi:hypothetical protein
MYCQFCGTPRVQGLSYCNRCGADLRERKESANTGAISASITEFMLIRNLSKLTSVSENKNHFLHAPPMHQEMRLPPAGSLGEPVPSVAENTTRTLDYVRRDR